MVRTSPKQGLATCTNCTMSCGWSSRMHISCTACPRCMHPCEMWRVFLMQDALNRLVLPQSTVSGINDQSGPMVYLRPSRYQNRLLTFPLMITFKPDTVVDSLPNVSNRCVAIIYSAMLKCETAKHSGALFFLWILSLSDCIIRIPRFWICNLLKTILAKLYVNLTQSPTF